MKLRLPLTFTSMVLFASQLLRAEIPLKPGDKVAFLGDSITEAGQGNPGGYVQLIGTALAAQGVQIEIIGAGISGHKSDQMLARLESDVLSKKPQWMTLSCGVNDVWHGAQGISLKDYKKNITRIVDKAQTAGIKVVLLTSTMIGEDQAAPENQKLVSYNEFLRSLAAEKKCLLADLNSDMQAALVEAKKANPDPAQENLLTSDGVHMTFPGDVMMAVGVLKGFGLDASELEKAKATWLDAPDTNPIAANINLTQRQVQQLEMLASERKSSVEDLINGELKKVVMSMLKPDHP